MNGHVASSEPSDRPPWNTPVPYLYGGLAAMAGLVVLALIILACSYWKLYGYLHDESSNDVVERDIESGGGAKAAPPPPPVVLEEKYLVIMAGQKNPTFVATPRSSRDSSFGCTSCSESSTLSDEEEKKMENSGGVNIETGHGNMETP